MNLCDVTVESFNGFLSTLIALVALTLFLVWAIPNGHCPSTCECKKTNRSHK